MVTIKIKKLHADATIPSYAKLGDAGMDLTAVSTHIDKYGNLQCNTGLAFEIPAGYVGYIFPRSSVSKYTLDLANSVGVIDSGYRGEVMFKFKPTPQFGPVVDIVSQTPTLTLNSKYKPGDRVGQLIVMPVPEMRIEEVEELSTTERGESGFGSSGK